MIAQQLTFCMENHEIDSFVGFFHRNEGNPADEIWSIPEIALDCFRLIMNKSEKLCKITMGHWKIWILTIQNEI
jgi:hypothetical protein